MLKKLLIIISTIFLYTACGNLEAKHFFPIPTSSNDGGFPGLMQDLMSGNWDRFKNKEEAIETEEVENFQEIKDSTNNETITEK